MSKRERKLEDSGYQFTGEFSSEYRTGKELMKVAAAVWRTRGYFAQVVSKTYSGRVTSSEGHSVYIKPKSVMTQAEFVDYKARLVERLAKGDMNVEHFQKQIDQLEAAIIARNKCGTMEAAEQHQYTINALLHGFSSSLDVHPVRT